MNHGAAPLLSNVWQKLVEQVKWQFVRNCGQHCGQYRVINLKVIPKILIYPSHLDCHPVIILPYMDYAPVLKTSKAIAERYEEIQIVNLSPGIQGGPATG